MIPPLTKTVKLEFYYIAYQYFCFHNDGVGWQVPFLGIKAPQVGFVVLDPEMNELHLKLAAS